jgi:N-hydroxyarylamine O-acetyltransferase
MLLQHYFQRINYGGDTSPDVNVLAAIQRRHACTIPFENLDVQLGKRLSTDVDAAYEKIVVNGRGGWCYEQNGLFGWALTEIGFDVTRVAAAVMRQERGDVADANHLCLIIRIPGTKTSYLADVGFGGGLLNPIEIKEDEYKQTPYRLGLRTLPDDSWRFWENNGSGEFSFDFDIQTADEFALNQKSNFLQSDPTSGFVLNLVTQIRTQDQHMALRGRVLSIVDASGRKSKTLHSANELVTALHEQFGLDVPQAAELWPKVVARHEEIFPGQAAAL